MKNFYLSLLLIVGIIINGNSQGTWTNSYAFHQRHLNSLALPDYYNVILVGGSSTNDSIQSIFKSNDGGLNYNIITDNISSWLKSVYFHDITNGIAVGGYGKALKTSDGGNTWLQMNIPGSVNLRHFNSVYFVDADHGFIVGGHQYNDSISTILKTNDGGSTWSISMDSQGYWLTSVHFPSLNNGFAVGEHGLLYKSTDGGNIWAKITIPGSAGSRNFSDVFFVDNNTGFIVGGNVKNDSIQTILKTTDGGNSWSVIRDSIAPMLNDIYFINASEGYAVGNTGTVLHTADGGNTWSYVIIPDNNPLFKFRSVKFLNPSCGYIVGDYGIIFRYLDGSGQGPITQTLPASGLETNNATLNGRVNPNGNTTSIEFEYGTTTSYGSSVASNPTGISGMADVNVSASLTGLNPNTLYHYRAKATNSMATDYGADMQFYTGNTGIPNFGFELWDTVSYNIPDSIDLLDGKISKIGTACHGSYAIRLENDANIDGPGSILIGNSDNGLNFYGGAPFPARPDTLTGCFNYNIIPNDTALIILFLKKNGTIISNQIFEIWGSSGGVYENLKFPITYSSADVPDSIIFGLVCTDIRYQQQILLGSILDVDYIRFSGTPLSIPNYDFETWNFYNYFTLESWGYDNKDRVENAGADISVVISNEPHSGNHAALVRNVIQASDTVLGELYTGDKNNQKFAINYKPIALTGFVKFFPSSGDSLFIIINMFAGTQNIGMGMFSYRDSLTEYAPFYSNIIYNTADIPDSASIIVQTYKNIAMGNSYAIIDDFNFDGYWAGVKDNPMVQAASSNINLNVYPNPFSNQATISFSLEQSGKVLIRLYNLAGEQVQLIDEKGYDAGTHEISLSAANLQKGFYICVITTNGGNYSKKIIVY